MVLLTRSTHTTRAWAALTLAAALAISGCSTTRAPRASGANVTLPGAWSAQPGGTGAAAAPATPTVDPSTLPGAENAGKPGYHTVRPGETVRKIAAEYNQDWRDIIRWNQQLPNPDVIEIGQVLRVLPPAKAPAHASATPPAAATTTTTPAAGDVAVATQTTPGVTPAATTTPPPVSPPAATAQTASQAGALDEKVSFMWPASGAVISGGAGEKGKALFIGGKAGDPVVAAADGKVVYAGAGLRGYGNLLIVQHTDAVISAYAHNRALLVKEKQTVKKGQRIAEMGDSHASRVMLRFEIRNNGKLVDPLRYLPAR